jgi:hypothetical protein
LTDLTELTWIKVGDVLEDDEVRRRMPPSRDQAPSPLLVEKEVYHPWLGIGLTTSDLPTIFSLILRHRLDDLANFIKTR